MNINIFVFFLLLSNYSFSAQECEKPPFSSETFLSFYESKCHYQIKVESEVIRYARKAEEFGYNFRYIKILELAEQRGSVEAQFLLGRYFYESSQSEEVEEKRLYKLAKGITKIFLSAQKDFEDAKSYYVKNICNSNNLKPVSSDQFCKHK